MRVVFRKLKGAFKTTNTRRGGFQNMHGELSEKTKCFQNHKHTARGLSESRRGFQEVGEGFQFHKYTRREFSESLKELSKSRRGFQKIEGDFQNTQQNVKLCERTARRRLPSVVEYNLV